MSSAPTLTPALPAGQAAEHLRLKLRPDLVVQPQFYEGMTHYVVKDPIGLKYFRFKVEEYFLLQQFDGKNSLQEIKKLFERKYRPQTITVEDLLRFASQLHEASLVQLDTPEQAKALITRRRKNSWKRTWQFLANILYIKLPIIDPERLLDWMYPFFRWIFTRTFVILSFMLMGVALLSVAANWSTFSAQLPSFESFFNWNNIFLFWTSLAVVKIIHEFGHGLTAKHFGGEVHEMGMLFLVMTPALYCDVTDSWLLPNKWKRIWISGAGIFVECFLAAVCTFIWWRTEPGVFKSLMLATMFICSVNTILFNANPLLRYDGYYVLSDLIEIPNLRIKSTQFFNYLIQDKVLGLEVPHQYLPRSRRFLFVTYAVASYLYRWVVSFGILLFLYRFLKPHKLGSISALLAIGSLIPLIVMPAYQMLKFVGQPGRMRKVKKARAAGYLVAFLALITGVLLIPTPLQIAGSLVLTSDERAPVYVQIPGRVEKYYVHDGDYVKEGQMLADLSNREKLRERDRIQTEISANRAKYDVLFSSRKPGDRDNAKIFATLADELEPALSKLTEQIGSLKLRAPRAGIVQGIPHHETEGRWINPVEGKPVCEIIDSSHLRAVMVLDQADIDLVNKANSPRAWIKIYGTGKRMFVSQVTEVASRNIEELPPELSNVIGGEIPAKPDPKTGVMKPLSAVYEVAIPVDNSDLRLQPGLRGRGRIDAGYATFGWWLWRSMAKTFNFML